MNGAELITEMRRLAKFSPAHDSRLELVEHAFDSMTRMPDACSLCRQCMQNRPVNIYARYCYAPCTPQSLRGQEPRHPTNPDPDMVFSEPPTYRQLRRLLNNGRDE